MRAALLLVLFVFVFTGLVGCSSSSTTQPVNNAAPPPQDSGADKEAAKSRMPAPPRK